MSLHPASLVSATEHSAELLQLLELKIARGLIEQLVQSTIEVVDFALDLPTTSSRGRSLARNDKQTEFTEFVSGVIERAEVTLSDILVTLIYIQRAKPYLSVQSEDWALHRVFLGALIVASKYTNDSTLKNIHWAMVSGTFGKRDIGRIEREFIEVLDWDFAVTEADLLAVYETLIHLLPVRRTKTVEVVAPPSSPVASESSHDSDSSESSHWSDEESDSDSHSTPATSPDPVTPSHAVFSPARPRSTAKPLDTMLDAIRHPFWHASHHPLSVHVVA